jgi:hypothetical protein
MPTQFCEGTKRTVWIHAEGAIAIACSAYSIRMGRPNSVREPNALFGYMPREQLLSHVWHIQKNMPTLLCEGTKRTVWIHAEGAIAIACLAYSEEYANPIL